MRYTVVTTLIAPGYEVDMTTQYAGMTHFSCTCCFCGRVTLMFDLFSLNWVTSRNTRWRYVPILKFIDHCV